MFRNMMKSKIHRARVTGADLNYVGSITIDRALMEAADILPNEKVQIVNNNNGARFETYAIPGEANSGVICLNGAAARLVQPGDVVIIISYALIEEKELSQFQSKVVLLDENNKIQKILKEEFPETVVKE
ncbi:aspartate 1-decarboxylase [Calderihabitans maritimus]|uniref:Aspartate 1-decarboxylase n=1 Tax=Calderihabitans maritimus TaxID=1246530 RepID=A0A1Z5HSA7_9FIRM|nr:aspartate 1-decarboxylase [Calderihabitans maritimus]GAW92211.1 aspartate decarboxylase [Calderihabitans maritimus]